jgi:transcriptional regulator with XRE-family HTH domain
MSNQTTTRAGVPQVEWDLADRLQKSLRVTGISNEDMAAACGTTRTTISRWLNGHTVPKRGMLAAWAMRCGWPFTLGWLETGEVDLRPDPNRGLGLPVPPSGWRDGYAGRGTRRLQALPLVRDLAMAA